MWDHCFTGGKKSRTKKINVPWSMNPDQWRLYPVKPRVPAPLCNQATPLSTYHMPGFLPDTLLGAENTCQDFLKHFICIKSSNPHNDNLRCILLSSLVYRRKHRGRESIRNMPEVTRLPGQIDGIQTQAALLPSMCSCPLHGSVYGQEDEKNKQTFFVFVFLMCWKGWY